MKPGTHPFSFLVTATVLAMCRALPTTRSGSGSGYDITVFNASYLWSASISNSDAHEHMQLLAALGGLVNRDTPNLFVTATDADQIWLEVLQTPGQWLQNATITEETSIIDLVNKYSNYFEGVVLYDGGVPASSNVASSIAGIKNLLPLLSGGTLFEEVCSGGPMLPVIQSLVGLFDGSVTGSRKNDAYKWFVNTYMAAGSNSGVNPAVHGYLMDYWWALNSAPDVDRLNVALLNADWVISNKGVLWDLDVWPDTTPNDDPTAAPGLDYEMLKELLRSSYELLGGSEMIHVAGFVPWAFKYITEEHDGVATEWQAAKILSAYNAFVDADACCELNNFANSAFYQHYPMPDKYTQNPVLTYDELVSKGYIDADTGAVVPKNYIRCVIVCLCTTSFLIDVVYIPQFLCGGL